VGVCSDECVVPARGKGDGCECDGGDGGDDDDVLEGVILALVLAALAFFVARWALGKLRER